MADNRDYYEVLGVQKGASEDEIKKAYKKTNRALKTVGYALEELVSGR